MKRLFNVLFSVIITFSMCVVLVSCSSDSVAGTYLGSSTSNCILRLEDDGTCTYSESDETGTGEGYYVELDDGSYEIDVSNLTYYLYATVEDNGDLFVTADSDTWSPEYFSKQ